MVLRFDVCHDSCGWQYCDIEDASTAVEHLRKKHNCCYADIRRPGCVDQPDSHGHIWYCFSCTKKSGWDDHRSFDCSIQFLQHLRDVHGIKRVDCEP